MKITVELEDSIDLNDYLDHDDVYQLMEEFDIPMVPNIPDVYKNINWRKLSLIDSQKIELFFEKFEDIPANELETFLNKY